MRNMAGYGECTDTKGGKFSLNLALARFFIKLRSLSQVWPNTETLSQITLNTAKVGNILAIKTCLDSFISLPFHGHECSCFTAWHLGPFWVSCEILLLMCWLESCPIPLLREYSVWESGFPTLMFTNPPVLSAFTCHIVVLDSSSSAFHGCGFRFYLLLLFSILLSSCHRFYDSSTLLLNHAFFPSFFSLSPPFLIPSLPFFLSSFVDKVSCCPWTDLELLIFLDLPPECWGYTCNQEVWFQLCFIIIIIIIIF